VCVSRLVARKGQDVLIRGMERLRGRVPGATLLIVGGGPYEETLHRLADAAPPGSVIFTGQVSEDDLPRYYAVGDVFAMPCRTRLGGLEVEGWGNVFIEAAACARPVVVGDSGGARESLVDGETGILVDGHDVAAVADAVARLLEDPALARRMGAAGRARVERAHTWPGSPNSSRDGCAPPSSEGSFNRGERRGTVARWTPRPRPTRCGDAPTAARWRPRTPNGADSASRRSWSPSPSPSPSRA